MYCNLHSHSSYSLLDGVGTTRQRAEKAKELGQQALAITDHGNLMGALEHIKDCKEVGIKPIVGVEAYFTPDRLLQTVENKKSYHLLLLAQNEQGFKNLIKCTTEGHTSGFYHKPRIDWEILEKYNEGIICSSACISGYVPFLIRQGERNKAEDAIEKHLQIFGDRYYLEIMPHDVPDQKMVNIELANLSIKYDIPIVATNDSHYPHKEWQDTQDVVLMIATGQTTSKREKKKEAGEDVYEINVDTLHMLSKEEMIRHFNENHAELPSVVYNEAIDNTNVIAERIEEFDLDRKNKMPKLSSNKNESKQRLVKWCNEGLKRVGKEDDQEYLDRLEYELEILEEKDVIDYMLLVGEMTRWAKSQGIRVSSGRGSAAGCLVSYLINITTIDPIAHGLLFERFITRSRKGLPDVDLDFQGDRRDEVKEWLSERYGEDKVANILALGNYKQRSSIKDVCRVLDVPYDVANELTKEVEDDTPLEIQAEVNKSVRDFAESNPDIWKHILILEGQPKQISQHAGGVVITDKPITEYMPLIKGKHGLLTAWSDKADFPIISDYGFLKIDVLSLDNLTRQGKCVDLIKQTTGEDVDIDHLSVAKDPDAADDQVMEIFRKGMCLGVFQFNSRGMTQFMKHIKPDSFRDLVAANALYRPGALGGGDAFEYAERKKRGVKTGYWNDEIVNEILEPTYGILIYQEQLQEIAQKVGNLTPEESDDFRKAASKLYRIPGDAAKDFMAKYEEAFMAGALENGLEHQIAVDIWERMLSFAQYSFNKSHSASYSYQGYQDAYLKVYYPAQAYASLLSIQKKGKKEEGIDDVIREAKAMNIEISPPDINRSESDFTLNGEILYGLLKVKYIGANAVEEIIANRPYKSVSDFRNKTRPKKVNRNAIRHLIMSGAFDSIGEREDFTIEEKRSLEKEALGVALSGSDAIKKYEHLFENNFNSQDDFDFANDRQTLIVAGEIINVKVIKDRKDNTMAFGELCYKNNVWNITFFSGIYSKCKDIISVGSLVAVRGKKDSSRECLIADNLTTLEKIQRAVAKG